MFALYSEGELIDCTLYHTRDEAVFMVGMTQRYLDTPIVVKEVRLEVIDDEDLKCCG